MLRLMQPFCYLRLGKYAFNLSKMKQTDSNLYVKHGLIINCTFLLIRLHFLTSVSTYVQLLKFYNKEFFMGQSDEMHRFKILGAKNLASRKTQANPGSKFK